MPRHINIANLILPVQQNVKPQFPNSVIPEDKRSESQRTAWSISHVQYPRGCLGFQSIRWSGSQIPEKRTTLPSGIRINYPEGNVLWENAIKEIVFTQQNYLKILEFFLQRA